ncbi:carbohydrate ABC transporter permease [Ruania halotolerans]|uniref:carbohydrate ABC transporter permease n=1 Tax=Ruania halotolerans TaxID=2897773 RepID=UPI001E3527BD|nr:sugar ABC transporter permease [Ruania halotolerans]UFU07802.1 sugar ABC transporter permease [Ruania halotolerans]
MTSTTEAPAGAGRGVSTPVPPRRRRKIRADDVGRILFVLPAGIAMALLFGYPVVKNVLMSLQEYTLTTFFTGEAPWVGLANYADVVSDPIFSQAMLNTGLFTAGSIVFQFAIGLALALFFKQKFPLSGPLRGLLLLPWLLPLIVSSATWRAILEQDSGILNQFLGLFGVEPIGWLVSPSVALIAVIGVNIWIGIPFNTTLLYSGLQSIPDELYEAGALDGATHAKAFRYITWPSLRPVISVVLILGVVYTLKVLDIILGLTGGGPANATQTLATQSYQRSFVDFEFGHGAALSNILIVISMVFAVVYLRRGRQAADE